jgi:hypothetical protein
MLKYISKLFYRNNYIENIYNLDLFYYKGCIIIKNKIYKLDYNKI